MVLNSISTLGIGMGNSIWSNTLTIEFWLTVSKILKFDEFDIIWAFKTYILMGFRRRQIKNTFLVALLTIRPYLLLQTLVQDETILIPWQLFPFFAFYYSSISRVTSQLVSATKTKHTNCRTTTKRTENSFMEWWEVNIDVVKA